MKTFEDFKVELESIFNDTDRMLAGGVDETALLTLHKLQIVGLLSNDYRHIKKQCEDYLRVRVLEKIESAKAENEAVSELRINITNAISKIKDLNPSLLENIIDKAEIKLCGNDDCKPCAEMANILKSKKPEDTNNVINFPGTRVTH